MQGPLAINVANHKALQLVLAEKKWTTRHEIVQVAEPAQAVPA
jgi:flagellar assembly factor FliW